MEATHDITSEELKDIIMEFQKDETYPNTDVTVMIINEEPDNRYRVELTSTQYKNFSKHRSDYFDDLKGHLNFNEQPILMFGMLPSQLFSAKGVAVGKVLGEKYSMNKEAPPLNYEPSFKTYFIEKN